MGAGAKLTHSLSSCGPRRQQLRPHTHTHTDLNSFRCCSRRKLLGVIKSRLSFVGSQARWAKFKIKPTTLADGLLSSSGQLLESARPKAARSGAGGRTSSSVNNKWRRQPPARGIGAQKRCARAWLHPAHGRHGHARAPMIQFDKSLTITSGRRNREAALAKQQKCTQKWGRSTNSAASPSAADWRRRAEN